MDSRTLQLLEFPKVLQQLSTFAVSEAGRDACLSLLPHTSLERIQECAALNREVLSFTEHTPLRLSSFPDLTGVFTFLANPLACLDEDGLVGFLAMLQVVADIKNLVAMPEQEFYPLLGNVAAKLILPPKTWSGLSRCLTPDGNIRDEASPELYSVRQEIRHIYQMCTRKVQEFLQIKELQHMLQDEYLTISSDRYVLALKSNFKGRLKGIVHHYSQTGETCYIEPLFLVELNNDLQEFRQEERAAEQKILQLLTDFIRSEEPSLRDIFDQMVHLDLLLAICHFSRHFDAQVVTVQDSGRVRLRNARHPLLVIGHEQVVPVDIELQDGQRVLVITGGNAGGKTVCLKTLGLLGLMAHAGLPIPADENSELPFWDQYVVSIGDEQSIEQSLSTFTAQIRNFSEVWPHIGARTLVILDEFGVGTDPTQGAALAQAVVDGLMDRKAWVGIATHFPALKAYGLSREGVRAASVIFSPDTKRPLFRLGYDQVGASRALDVAREQGLPEEILSKAQEYLYLDSGYSEEIFDRLNQLSVAKEQELVRITAQGQALEQKYAQKMEKLEQERKRVTIEVRQAAQEIMRQWRAARCERKESLKKLAQLREAVGVHTAENIPEEKLCLTTIVPGQVLFYLPWKKNGVVRAVDIKKKRVQLELSGVSLWVGLEDIAPMAEQAQQNINSSVIRPYSASVLPLRLDLRGLRTHEAEMELDRFLDQALLAGRTAVEIIHGLGSGAMRQAVHEHLRRSRAVQSFNLGNADEGGDGITKVVLAE